MLAQTFQKATLNTTVIANAYSDLNGAINGLKTKLVEKPTASQAPSQDSEIKPSQPSQGTSTVTPTKTKPMVNKANVTTGVDTATEMFTGITGCAVLVMVVMGNKNKKMQHKGA